MKWRLVVVLVLLWALPAFANPDDHEVAGMAKIWLALVDAKNYPDSWKDAADIFHQGVSEAKWNSMVGSIRDKVGPVKSRDFQSAQFTKTLPGVPDGDYAIVSFRTDFETKGASTEVITLVHENGNWK